MNQDTAIMSSSKASSCRCACARFATLSVILHGPADESMNGHGLVVLARMDPLVFDGMACSCVCIYLLHSIVVVLPEYASLSVATVSKVSSSCICMSAGILMLAFYASTWIICQHHRHNPSPRRR